MPKNISIFILGILVAVTPFVGFPVAWRAYILLVAGILIAVLSFVSEKGGALARYFKIPDTRTQSLFKSSTQETETPNEPSSL